MLLKDGIPMYTRGFRSVWIGIISLLEPACRKYVFVRPELVHPVQNLKVRELRESADTIP